MSVLSSLRHYSRSLRRQLRAGEQPLWLQRHPRRSYLVAAALSMPEWVDRKEILAIYRLRDKLTAETGVEHVVDHEVPLNHPRVHGLTVPWNLRVIPRAHNAAKGNYWCPEQTELAL